MQPPWAAMLARHCTHPGPPFWRAAAPTGQHAHMYIGARQALPSPREAAVLKSSPLWVRLRVPCCLSLSRGHLPASALLHPCPRLLRTAPRPVPPHPTDALRPLPKGPRAQARGHRANQPPLLSCPAPSFQAPLLQLLLHPLPPSPHSRPQRLLALPNPSCLGDDACPTWAGACAHPVAPHPSPTHRLAEAGAGERAASTSGVRCGERGRGDEASRRLSLAGSEGVGLLAERSQ